MNASANANCRTLAHAADDFSPSARSQDSTS
jgi:hypothetical protein